MNSVLQVIAVVTVLFTYKNAMVSSEATYYAVNAFSSDKYIRFSSKKKILFLSIFRPSSLHGSIRTFDTKTSQFPFYANFSFHIDDNDTELYYFVPGPVAIVNDSSPLMYMSVQCGTAFQRLFLLIFDMTKKTYRQSQWILHDGGFAYLLHDPLRQRLFGLRDVSTFTLIIEEYNMTTLDVVRKYTQQDGSQYAFPYAAYTIFDYEENWIVEVRTRFENPSVNAYYIKMDLNLVGKKDDIVTEFHLMPNVHNLCTMTYDMKTKKILATWQHGSIDQNLVMIYMDRQTGKFSNETLLFKVDRGHDWVIEDTQAIFDEQTRQVLFLIKYEQDSTFADQFWIMLVDFDTMKINMKKQVKSIADFSDWELFVMYS